MASANDQLQLLAAWREAPIYSPKECAALAWAEALTRLTGGDVSNEVYIDMRQHFSEKEVADLLLRSLQSTTCNAYDVHSDSAAACITSAKIGPPRPFNGWIA